MQQQITEIKQKLFDRGNRCRTKNLRAIVSIVELLIYDGHVGKILVYIHSMLKDLLGRFYL